MRAAHKVAGDGRGELKAQILGECAMPGASVAKVAMAHGVNANIVHGWRKLARETEMAPVARQEFVPVAVASAPSMRTGERGVDVELRRGSMTIRLTWPTSAASDLAIWMRELLR